MSDESPFGDFSAQPAIEDEEPIALPPPGSGGFEPSEDTFGLSSPPQPTADDQVGGEDEVDPFAAVDGGNSAAAFDSFSNGQQVEVKEEEAAALRDWERERADVLRARQGKAEADKQALLTNAKDELNKFYADRESTLSKQQKTNRADEKNYRSDMKSTFENGTRWEKVSKLVSTAPRANEKAGTSRVDRMRKLLLQLKTEKPKQ